MKLFSFVSLGIFLFSVSGSSVLSQGFFDPELDKAVDRMFAQGLTKYDSSEKYRPADPLTREQAAKFFSEFALTELNKSTNVDASSCIFSDIGSADETLLSSIESACLLGLFKGSGGRFNPTDELTKAEALTVLVRAVSGLQNESTDPRWYEYHKEARQLGLTREENVLALDRSITRYEVALILYRARDDQTTQTEEETDSQLQELFSILQDLGLRSE